MARFGKKAIWRRTFEALKVGKNTIFWDSEFTGFGVRGHPTGRKVYIGQDGEVGDGEPERRHRPGRSPAPIVVRIRAGEDPVPAPMAVKLTKGPTVGIRLAVS